MLRRSGVSGLISSRDGRVVRIIVPVPVSRRLLALTGARCNPKTDKGPLAAHGPSFENGRDAFRPVTDRWHK
jgi:hypothetical protein